MPTTSLPIRNRRLPTATPSAKANARKPPARIVRAPATASGHTSRVAAGRTADVAHATRVAAANKGSRVAEARAQGAPPNKIAATNPRRTSTIAAASTKSALAQTADAPLPVIGPIFLTLSSPAPVGTDNPRRFEISHTLPTTSHVDGIQIRNAEEWTVRSLQIGGRELVQDGDTFGVPADLINRVKSFSVGKPSAVGGTIVIRVDANTSAPLGGLVVDLVTIGIPGVPEKTKVETELSTSSITPPTGATPIAPSTQVTAR